MMKSGVLEDGFFSFSHRIRLDIWAFACAFLSIPQVTHYQEDTWN